MDTDTFETLVRLARLEPLLKTYRDDLKAAAEHVEALRGALDGVSEAMQEPWPAVQESASR